MAEETAQLGDRVKKSIKKRVDEYRIRHPLQPSRATIIELALTEWLDKHEPELGKPKGK